MVADHPVEIEKLVLKSKPQSLDLHRMPARCKGSEFISGTNRYRSGNLFRFFVLFLAGRHFPLPSA
jgi:hypothetical protein